MLITSEDDNGLGKEDKEKKIVVKEEKDMEVSQKVGSIVKLNTLKSMELVEVMKKREVVILLDSDAVHNFISKNLVTKLQLLVTPAQFSITLGDGLKVKGVELYEGVKLQFQGISVIQSLSST